MGNSAGSDYGGAQLEIPLFIWRTHVTALETGVVYITVRNPYVDSAPSTQGSLMTAEYRGFASLYREALESNSRACQFPCLFKIAGGRRLSRSRVIPTYNSPVAQRRM